jgi:hypothetical protein
MVNAALRTVNLLRERPTMKRRQFIKSAAIGTLLPTMSTGVMCGQNDTQSEPTSALREDTSRHFLSLRKYVIEHDRQVELVSRFLQSAALPALQRLKVGPIGVFHEIGADATKSMYTLMPLQSLDQLVAINEALAADQEFLSAAEEYLSTELKEPAYQRIEAQLMRAFEGFPRIQVPRQGERIFELRVYESHNEYKAWLKIQMFNQGELDIFRQVGLDGVFFGETLVGPALPNLTYMLAYQDMPEHDRAWDAFRTNADWLKLKDDAQYRDTVSKIVNQFLKPAEYSEI